MRVVTGRAGFIGSHLIEALAEDGAEVVCVERPGVSRQWLKDAQVTWRECGVEDEIELVRAFDEADLICAALRGKAAVLNRGRVREMSQQRWVCDPRRAMREVGFAPRFAIARIPETAAWYREARWL